MASRHYAPTPRALANLRDEPVVVEYRNLLAATCHPEITGETQLHAVGLGFTHPTRGEHVEFSSPYPADLQRALDLVRAD